MRVIIEKHERRLTVFEGEREVFRCRAAWDVSRRVRSSAKGMGVRRRASMSSVWSGAGQVWAQPGPVLSGHTGCAGGAFAGEIDRATFFAVDKAHREGRRPPWGSPLGGEIYIHEGGSQCDWTQGCIALDASDMDRLFSPAGPSGGRGDPP